MYRERSACLIISIIAAIIWAILGTHTIISTGEFLGLEIGVILMIPYLMVSSIGVLLHMIGGFACKRGLVLAGLIMECVSISLGIIWGFGFVLAIILGFIGYAKMPPY